MSRTRETSSRPLSCHKTHTSSGASIREVALLEAEVPCHMFCPPYVFVPRRCPPKQEYAAGIRVELNVISTYHFVIQPKFAKGGDRAFPRRPTCAMPHGPCRGQMSTLRSSASSASTPSPMRCRSAPHELGCLSGSGAALPEPENPKSQKYKASHNWPSESDHSTYRARQSQALALWKSAVVVEKALGRPLPRQEQLGWRILVGFGRGKPLRSRPDSQRR